MSATRRAAIFKLASAAYQMQLDVMQGVVTRNTAGQWRIGEHDLESWLASHEGEEFMVFLGSLDDKRPVEPRTCRTCGRDYTDIECPHCRANRIRLRGQA